MKKKRLNAVNPTNNKKQICIEVEKDVIKFSNGTKVKKPDAKELKELD